MSTDPPPGGMSRRSFLIQGSLFIAAAGGLVSCTQSRRGGGMAGSNWKTGHLLLGSGREAPQETRRSGVVIVGGGVAGLSAARDFIKRGFTDFELLELDDRPGGNAASGSNAVSAYPWGAHYIPIPGAGAHWVRELFEDIGVIEGYDSRGLPIYHEYFLCADPQERLFIHGHWQEGLVPQLGVSPADKAEYDAFFGAMQDFRKARGSDGRRAFAIPLDHSSADPRFLKYDGITMARYLDDNGWKSPYLRWYVDYCCRDDYGCPMDRTSAWAGIHYFAARDAQAANADPHAVLTWPDGIGWVVKKITAQVAGHISCGACVMNIEESKGHVAVDYFDVRRGKTVRILADAVVYAAPRFTALRTLRAFREKQPAYAADIDYGPWMIANATVRGIPGGQGAPVAWDNVRYGADSLGYVVANHQDLSVRRAKTVLTCYFPLTAGAPGTERRAALGRSHAEWSRMVADDLLLMHPGIETDIENIDVWLWGHAMLRPSAGFIWGPARRAMLAPFGNIFFAHSDMSGISIFEEAQYRGITAARAAMKKLGGAQLPAGMRP